MTTSSKFILAARLECIFNQIKSSFMFSFTVKFGVYRKHLEKMICSLKTSIVMILESQKWIHQSKHYYAHPFTLIKCCTYFVFPKPHWVILKKINQAKIAILWLDLLWSRSLNSVQSEIYLSIKLTTTEHSYLYMLTLQSWVL